MVPEEGNQGQELVEPQHMVGRVGRRVVTSGKALCLEEHLAVEEEV